MFEQFHADYKWEGGAPLPMRGLNEWEEEEKCYRIVQDSYAHRISVEEYRKGKFSKLIYDSALLDFRKLRLEFKLQWESTRVREEGDLVICEVRDEADRLVIIEKHQFEEGELKRCELYYPQGEILLAVQRFVGDKVELYDSNEHLVMEQEIRRS